MSSDYSGVLANLGTQAVLMALLFAWLVLTSQPEQVRAEVEAISLDAVHDAPLFTDEAKASARDTGRAWFGFDGVTYVVEDTSGWEAYL